MVQFDDIESKLTYMRGLLYGYRRHTTHICVVQSLCLNWVLSLQTILNTFFMIGDVFYIQCNVLVDTPPGEFGKTICGIIKSKYQQWLPLTIIIVFNNTLIVLNIYLFYCTNFYSVATVVKALKS